MYHFELEVSQDGLAFTKGLVELIMQLAQHDPPAPSDPALCVPTLPSAQWVRIEGAVEKVIFALQLLREASTAKAGKSLCKLLPKLTYNPERTHQPDVSARSALQVTTEWWCAACTIW